MADPSTLYKTPEGYRAMMAWYDDVLARIPVPVESRTVETRWGPTHILVTGPQDAPPLVLISGLGGNALLWRTQLADFADKFRVCAVDVIGQTGRSAGNRPPHHGPAYAEWLLDVFDGLGLEQADIAGASLGGRLVIKFGAHPAGGARIRRAVLISAIGLATLDFRLFLRVLPIGLNLRTAAREKMTALMRYALSLPEEDPLGEDLERMLEGFMLFGRYYRQEALAGLPMVFPLPRRELEAFNAPCLLLMGEQERLFNPRRVIGWARQVFPHLVAAELVPDAGHGLIVRQRDDVDRRIRAFLEGGWSRRGRDEAAVNNSDGL
jgi:pimeloyl-ACP methyl ester carboxylesterase